MVSSTAAIGRGRGALCCSCARSAGSAELARRRLVPSQTTPAGLVRHLIGVEHGWLQADPTQRPPVEIGPNVGGSEDANTRQSTASPHPTNHTYALSISGALTF
ncbi:DUF664 domain-containing protein [Dactylosporangium cerinum]|uniref:DUF664 domain-containing protein n=1 Tax=Dactylosporangium cerinum TaxID=1434730 RepID=A0ABV9WD24_9ACTN